MTELTKSKDMTPYDFRELEKRDEAQILAELKGEIVDEMIYQFPSGGRTVTGISWMGIKEIARRYGKIDVNLVHFEDLGNAYMIVVKAIDIEKGTGLLGTSTQSKMLKRRDGSETHDDFCVQKAMSKAQRNAIRSIIPETYFKTVFAELAKDHPPKNVESEQLGNRGSTGRNGLGIALKEFTPKGIMDYLAQNLPELNRGDFVIKDLGGAYEIKVTRFIDYWGPVNGLVESLGGEWISFEEDSKKKDNHWWLPKPDEPQEEPQEGAPPFEPEEEPAPEPEEEEEEPPQKDVPEGVPRSVEDVIERIASVMPGHSELVVVSDRGDYYRIGRKVTLDTEIENHLDFLVTEMGGEFNKDKNEWRIPRGAEG